MKHDFHKGFSLIEVMVALLVLAMGVLAVVKLQGVLIQSASDSTQRAVAVSLAQQKIDDLRSFTDRAGFVAIGNNVGGEIEASPVEFEIEREPYRYALWWEVDEPTGESKIVNVFVAWLDEAGGRQEINLETMVDSYVPALTSLPGKASPGGTPPKVPFTPEPAPDVIDIAVDTGGDRFRQTSRPAPEVFSRGGGENTIVSFDVMTYRNDAGSSFATRQEEFVSVDCNCELAGTGRRMTPAFSFWNGDTRVDHKGEWVTEQTAVEKGNTKEAEALCQICCRDHHEIPGRESARFPLNVPYSFGAGVQRGNEYRQSCRMKRIDGVFRVFQDWNLGDITVLNRLQLLEAVEEGQKTLLETYQTYVEGLVVFLATDDGTQPLKPADRTPVELPVNAGRQLQSRGVFLDNVYCDKDKDYCEGGKNPDSYKTAVRENPDGLELVPFAEVNLTLLSEWMSGNEDGVSVTNEPVVTIPDPENNYYGVYSRGYIIGESENAQAKITASMLRNNDGLTQAFTTEYQPGDAAWVSDSVTVKVGEQGSVITISGTFSIEFPLGRGNQADAPEIDWSGAGSCEILRGNEYTCSMESPWTGFIRITVENNVRNRPEAHCSGESEESWTALNEDRTYNFAFSCTQ